MTKDKLKITVDMAEPAGLDPIPQTKKEEVLPMADEKNLPEQPGLSFGIEETKDVVSFGVALANSAVSALQDGKISLGDMGSFVSPLMKLPAAITNIGHVPSELGDLQEEEVQVLLEEVKANLDVDDEKAKEIVQASLNVVYSIYGLVKLL